MNVTKCNLCPRMCSVNRTLKTGYCGGESTLKLARAALYMWEEPCISGTNGSGTVFFSGCPLRCCYCQNHDISHDNYGKNISIARLNDIFLELQSKGAHNINLVNPTHYVPWIIEALDLSKNKLQIPIVYNSSGYETIDTISMLEGYIDIYLPDLKYYSSDMSQKYSMAGDYFSFASEAIIAMQNQVGAAYFDENGIMQRGLIIRHLVLPSGKYDSCAIIDWIASALPINDIFVSIMSQYTPFYKSCAHKEINRRITSIEYDFVVNKMLELGIINGFMQEKSSAKEEYTPSFNLEGV